MRVISGVVCLTLVAGTARAERGEPWDARTVGEQLGGGIGGAASGALGLGLLGFGIGYLVGAPRDISPAIVGGALGVLIGATGGMAVGVQLAGDANDGTGRWWATGAGSVVGAAAAVGFWVGTADLEMPKAVRIAAGIVLGLTPTIAAYHLSADEPAVTFTPLAFRF